MGEYDCHRATEIWPGLLLGAMSDVEDMVLLQVEVLVPLAFLRGAIWNSGFRGEIDYCPIEDGGVLPDDVLDALIERLLSYLQAGKRVGLFCSGGHGRTGYVAACLLYKLGVRDPISYLYDKYCLHAIETDRQVSAVIDFMERNRNQD